MQTTRLIRGGAVCLLIAAIAVTSRTLSRREPGRMERLVRAAAGERMTDGRLSGFPRAARKRTAASSWQVVEAAAAVAGDAQHAGDTESLHVTGVAELLMGRVAAAVTALNTASKAAPGDASLLNDLSVAHLERAAREGTARDVVDAYELADEAFRIDPQSREAAFNRALAIERLGFRTEAIAAWNEAVRRDPGSPWSGEAAERARRLVIREEPAVHDDLAVRLRDAAEREDADAVSELVRQYPQQSRAHFEEEVIGDWAAADRTERGRLLHLLRMLASALRAVTGNVLPERAVAAIDAAAGRPAVLAGLVEAHSTYQNAMRRYRKIDMQLAEPELARAADLFRQADSPFAFLALFYRASAHSYGNNLPGTLALLDEVRAEVDREGLKGSPLEGHIEWMRGKTLLNQGLPYASLLSLERALVIFQKANEAESTAAIHDLLAWNYDFLGDEERGWANYTTALGLVAGGQSMRRERIILHDLTYHSSFHHRQRMALFCAAALVRLCRAHGDSSDVARSLLDRSRAVHALGDREEAWKDFREASSLEPAIADRGVQADLRADLAVAECELAGSGGPAAVIVSLDKAIAVVREVQKNTVLPRLLIERGRMARQTGEVREAEKSLAEAIAIVEQQRASVADSSLQIGYEEEWYHAFDAMVDLLVEQGRTEEALAFAERSRARALLGETGRSTATPQRFAGRIPEGVAVVVFSSLENSTVVWVVRREGTWCSRLPVSRAALEGMVAAGSDAARAERSPDGPKAALSDLHRALFEPLAARLPPADRIVFVPDKSLHRVPFAALYDRHSQRWLVEDRIVSIAPSLELFITLLDRDDRLAAAEGRDRIVVVGDPAFDRDSFPDLPRLDAAAREARDVARLYRRGESLIGAAATRARVLEAMLQAPIVHVAAHAIVNERHPSASALLLAADGADNGVLYASQVGARTFESTRLMVLAGCSTASGKQTLYEGPLGLARTFVAAGVPSVVATLWDIEDDASHELMLTFHRRLRAGDDAPTALRAAQLDLIHHKNDSLRRVPAWAGFEVLGAFFR